MITLKASVPEQPGTKMLAGVARLLELHELLTSEGYTVSGCYAFWLMVEVEAERDITWLSLKHTEFDFEIVDNVD